MNRNWLKNLGLSFLVLLLLLSPLYITPVHALSAPILTSPANNAITTVVDTPPLGIPEFQWQAVPGATIYHLQVSGDIAFTTLIIDITTPNTTFTPTSANPFSDGVWYWRVRVEAPAPVSSYSSIWSFTKQWATASNSPVLSSPANAASIDFYDQPVFSWSSVTGAAYYRIQIYSSSGGWTSSIYTATTMTTTHQPSIKLANGTYYWRIVPIDAGNRDGTPSIERSFIASYNFMPALLEPIDGATPTFTPTFRWKAVRGAQLYRLQYTTDPTFNSGLTQIDTRNTSFTPTSTLPNDVNYYWRVRVHSGNSISDWTPSRTFIKKWYIKPVLLTPTNLYQHVRFPIFSWTPVPGASYYKVDLSLSPGFADIKDSGTTSNTFYTPQNYWGASDTYYWRVTPYDGDRNAGVTSDTKSYVSYFQSVAPQQVYPLYYYPPDTYSGFPGVTTNPHEDRTVALPIFIWHRVFVPAKDPNDEGQVYADAYRLEVSTDPLFDTVNWTVDTENLVAAPTTSNPFTPLTNTNYFWRVRPLIGGIEVGQWSQIWKARFNPSLALAPTSGLAPTLIRPTAGFEFAEATPLLEWFPLSGATSYDVQISLDQDFGTTVDTATVSSPAYVPTQSLAQRNLGSLDFGIYYWRVRQSPNGAWSETRRFQIAAQSQWKYARTLGDTLNRLQIGSDPTSDVAANYDLTSLQVAQSHGYWYFGFHVPTSPTLDVTYAFYLDTDHRDASGATNDARGYSVSTIASYRPEYVIYVLQKAGVFSATKVYVYRWTGTEWDTPDILDSIGGLLNKNGDYVEIQVPNTAIGYQDNTGSYAVSLFSLPAGSGQPQDSVPSDPNVPVGGAISRFANVTERMNMSMPPNDAGVDPSTYPSVQPFFWDWSIHAPWSGALMEAHLDPAFTSKQADYILTSDTAYYAQTSHAWGYDFSGDNTYYWRIQPRYRVEGVLYSGAWSQGWRFERKGFLPQNLKTSVTFATPTFSWDMVEGAESYDLQVDDDPNFASPAININTKQYYFTDIATLANATYYWHVRVRRYGNVVSSWTSSQSFTLALPKPTGLNSNPSGVVGRAPTLCWTPVIMNSPTTSDPVFAAYAYRVQISKDPTFSSIFDNIDTEQSCWTPTKGYDDGQYYWRVALFDGDGKLGSYSDPATFTKQYPITTLLSPTSGGNINTTPTFIWTPVNGSARYRFESSLFSTFSPLYEGVTTDNCRWTPTSAYAAGQTYYWRVAIVDSDGKAGPFVGATIILDNPNPSVSSITLVNPSPTNLASVQYTVIFSKSVTGVDSADFSLATTGITGASITNVTGSGANYTVTVNTGAGNGTIRLDVIANGTILDSNSNPLTNGFSGGDTYTIVKSGVIISGNAGIGGTTLAYTNGTPQIATADANGNYTIAVPLGWTGTVTPSNTGYVFVPTSRTYTNVTAAWTSQDYVASSMSSFASMTYWTNDYNYNIQGWRANLHPRVMGDVNGDDKADIIGFGYNGVLVALSTGTGFAPMKYWTADYNYNTQGWRAELHPRMAADVNGDKKADLVGFGNNGVLVALSTGTSFAPMGYWTTDYNYNVQGWRANLHPRVMGDVNGDEKADIIGFGYNGVLVALSTGTGFAPMKYWTTDYNYNAQGWRTELHPRMVADVNGDKKADLVGFGYNGVLVALSTGTNFAPMSYWTNDYNYNAQGWRANLHPRVMGDVNGDGKADVIGFGYNGVLVALSTGTGFAPMKYATTDYNYSTQGWRANLHPRMAADVNGDKWVDLVGFGYNGVLIGLSQ